jgi:hypothetical protein
MEDIDIKSISLLDRPEEQKPIAKNPDEMKQLRDEFRRISYSDVVKKETSVRLPDTVKELREALDAKAEQLALNDKDEKEQAEHVPGIVLRKKDKDKDWAELGWSRADREAVKNLLKRRLKLTDDPKDKAQAENILEIIVASGKTSNEVLDILNDDEKFDHYFSAEGRAQIGQFTAEDQQFIGVSEQARGGYFYLRNELGLKDVYIRRFIMDDDFRHALDYEYDNTLPQNLFDLAWNLMYRAPELWGINGKFPVLQIQVEKFTDENGKERVRGRYVANQANMMRWIRERMYYRWDTFETDDPLDPFQVITIPKGQFATVSLGTIIFDEKRYFTDETGYMWKGLYNQMFIEPWMLLFDRQYHIEYDRAAHDDEQLVKAYQNWAHLSKFTRKVIGQSMLDRSLSLPVDFNGRDSDTKLGEALLTMYLAYYNLTDFDMLKEVLGEDSPFFTKNGWINAAAEFAGEKTIPMTGGVFVPGKFLGAREDEFEKAFDKETGMVTEKTKSSFLKMINPFYQENPPQTIGQVLKTIIKNSVREQLASKEGNGEQIDDDSLNYAWLKAYSWFYFSGGAARSNFPKPSGHFMESRWYYTDAYRLKYMGYGGAGNPYTVNMFKQIGIPFFEGLLSENAYEHYITGYDEKGKPKWGKRQLTPMEIMIKMRRTNAKFETMTKELRDKFESTTNPDEKEKILREINRIEDISKNYSKEFASQMEFHDHAMRVYSKNIVGRVSTLYGQVMKGQETAFDKFTKYDSVFRGVNFDREAWQDALQSKLITPLRYLFEANGATQLNMMVRAPVYAGRDKDGNPKWEHKWQPLGERMMGHQILDIPEFRMRKKDLTPEKWSELKHEGCRIKGKYIVDRQGKHKIDYNKVQENKPMVYKQWMLMKIAGDLWSHIDRHSTDPAYGMNHYLNIIDAIRDLPGDLTSSEYDLRGARISKMFFSKEQIKWLRKISRTTMLSLFNHHFWADLFMGDKRKKESVFGESTGIILNSIFKGY